MDEEQVIDGSKNQAADKLATASFVLGIISLFSTFCCCPFVFSGIGIILALLSKGAEQVLRQKAKIGLILSSIGIGVSIVVTTFTIGFPIFMFKTNPQYREQFLKQYTQTLKENESVLRQVYGDDMYEQIEDMIDEMEDM